MSFEMWAGTGYPESWAKTTGVDSGVTVWPIINKETCGTINGYPRPDQWYCVALDHKDQERICNALNTSKG